MSVPTAVILAAGVGSRLGELARGLPKGFVEVDGETLIERSLRLLRAAGITRTVLVTGYRRDAYDALIPHHPGLETHHNAAFADSGSMASLAVAIPHLDQGFLLLESDLFYEPRALDLLLESRAEDLVLASGATGAGDEVYVDGPMGRLVNLSKDPRALGSLTGELVGICKLSMETARAMEAAFRRHVTRAGHAHMAYETDALVEVARERSVGVELAFDLLWGEVDCAEHLQRVREQVAPQLRGRPWPKLRTARPILLNPGPATTRPEVKQALVIPDVCPREASFCAQYAEVRERLAALAGNPRQLVAIPLAGSGTLALEALLGSVIGPEDRLLILDNGDYGARLGQIAQRLCVQHETWRIGWSQPVDLAALEARLSHAAWNPTHLAVVHHETSSGLLNPLPEISALARRHGVRTLVDAMSSFGALPLELGPHGVDALVSSANKCLEGMAGVAFAILTRDLLAAARGHQARSFALDLVSEADHLEATGQSRFTVPPQLFSALLEALRLHDREGREAREARYAHSMRTLMDGLRELGFQLLLPPQHQSHILVAVREPDAPWFDFQRLHAAMLERGFTIYPGKPGSVRTFRLSVLGAIDASDIQRFLRELAAWVHAARSAQ